MYGQYGHSGLFSGCDGNSSHSESLSFPGANSKSKKKRVPLLGKTRRTSQPVPILPLLTALKAMAEDEKINNAHEGDGNDISLMSLPSDLSHDGDGVTPGVNSFPQYSDKEVIENLEGQLCSNTGSQACLELTSNSISMQETRVSSQDLKCHEVRPEELENVVPESVAVDQISEVYEACRYVNNPEKNFLISENKSSTHSEHLPAGSLLSNQQQERIVKNNNSSKNVGTLLGQKAKAKAMEPHHEEVSVSTALCVKKEDEKFHMGPSLMCSCLLTHKGGVLRDIINHKDTLNSKMKSIDVRGTQKNMQASEENVKQIDVSNKENDIGMFSSESAAYNITNAKHSPSCNNIPVFDPNLLHVSKERNSQILARKGVAMEKQLDEKMKPCMPFCNLNMVDMSPPVDNIQHVRRNIEVNDEISKLKPVELSINKENNFHSSVRKNVITEKQIHHPVVDGCVLFRKVNVKESTPSFDDVIPGRQEHQTDKADSQPDSLNKLNSKAVKECSAENIKDPSLISTLGTSTVERTVAAQGDLKMQPEAGLKLVYKQGQNVPLKLVEKQDNYITVNGKGYKVQKLLGRGGSSQVFKVLDPSTMQELAVKCVNLSVAEPSIAQGYLNEIALLRRLQGSETVITMTDFEYAEDKQMLYVVMEKGETDLSRLIKKISKTNQIHIITILYYWVEILRAVKNIHENGVIHSDLKPANFLLVGGRMKLIDFGIASSIQSDMTSVFKDSQAGTFNYMSPEAVQATHSTNGNKSGFKISYKSDIWSLGCILYNLLYGKTPFQHIVQPWAKVAAITNPDHVIDFSNTRNDCPPVLLKAVQLCLIYDPKKRPTAAELLELPYINYNVV